MAKFALENLDLQKTDQLEDWFERFDLYCATDDRITESNQTAYLLTYAGGSAYNLVKNLAFPRKPNQLKPTEIRDILLHHLRPMNFQATERARFHTLIRQESQGIKEFILQLQIQAAKCAFGNQLEDQLRDRIVAGINNSQIQRKLLLQPNLSLQIAKEICESSANVSEAMQMTSNVLYSKPRSTRKQPVRQHSMSSNFSGQPGKSIPSQSTGTITCFSCGGSHLRNVCKFKNAQCHKCSKLGHISKVCRSQGKEFKPHKSIHLINDSDSDSQEQSIPILRISKKLSESHLQSKYTFSSGEKLSLIQDTGSPLSFLSERSLRLVAPDAQIQVTTTKVTGVTGHELPLIGKCFLSVSNSSKEFKTVCFYVTHAGPDILGLDGMRALQDKIVLATNVGTNKSYANHIVELIQACAKNEGGLNINPVKLDITAEPIFMKRRPIAYGLQEPVKVTLDKLVAQRILEPIECSKWATPIVTPLKSDGQPRVCGDFKVTINPFLKQKATTTPEPEDVFSSLEGSTVFSKIDLQNAFLQIPLDEASQELTTINTMWGLYSHKFLPFGLSTSPSIFQEVMDTILKDLTGVESYQDDIIVFGKDKFTHDACLLAVLKRLNKYNVKINASKSVFEAAELSFLGFKVTSKGIQPDPQRFKPLMNSPHPNNTSELRSLLGCLQYYSRFIANFAALATPLFNLMKTENNDEFLWQDAHTVALNKIKSIIQSLPTLVPFKRSGPTELVVDASEYAIGGVLEQNGSPVICISRKLSKAEIGYSQTQKEALAVVWCLKRLHKFLFNHKFTIVTDHQSLKFIFNENSSLSKGTSNMLQRWALLLSAYDYNIVHRAGKLIPQADFLSRYAEFEEPENQTHNALFIQPLPIPRNELIEETKKVYGPVIAALKRGWSNSAKKRYQELYTKRDELSLSADGLICWRDLVVIPPSHRKLMLEHLHGSHLGIDKMKSLGRLLCWWPLINSDILHYTQGCKKCKTTKQRDHPQWSAWPVTYESWQRVHMDYCGPFLGRYYALVLIDSFSKWPEVFLTESASSDFTIKALRKTFSREGIPKVLVSDNGTHFNAQNVKSWLKSINCTQVFAPPRHPQSNGLAENFVKTLKSVIKAQGVSTADELEQAIDSFLLQYRNSEHSSSKQRPAVLFKGRALRQPTITSTELSFQRGSDLRPCQGIVLKNLGKCVVEIMDLNDGSVHKRHIDQVSIHTYKSSESPAIAAQAVNNDISVEQATQIIDNNNYADTPRNEDQPPPSEETNVETMVENQNQNLSRQDIPAATRQSSRSRGSPTYLRDYVK